MMYKRFVVYGWRLVLGCWMMLLPLAGCGGGDSSSAASVDTGEETQTATATEEAPTASFSVSVAVGSYPLSVTFNASGASDDTGIAAYDWAFGDGATGEGVRTVHTYRSAGSYTAQLTVTDTDGLSDTATHAIEVKSLFSISGTVRRGEYIVVDSDVNDPNAEYVDNGAIEAAQGASAPCSISGYVNVAGTGASGRSSGSGDPDDFYQVDLSSGMEIALYMAEDPSAADLNLYLYDSETNLVDSSVTAGASMESLSSPGSGTYYVRVEAGAGASNYILTIGLSLASAASHPLRVSSDFVPGEVLVRFEAADGDDVAHLAGSGGHASSMGFYTRAGDRGRDRLLKRSETVDDAAFFAGLGIQSSLSRSLSAGRVSDETRERMETLWMVRALQDQPGVVYAEPNYIVTAFSTEPDDTYYDYQWHYPLINLPDAWDVTTGDEAVVVAVLDTGVLSDHPDLSGQLVDGYDFVDEDDDPTDEYEYYHGTHVAGTIAAASDNGIGVAGVAWNARIMPLRVLDDAGSGTMSDILDAVRYAAGLDDAGTGGTLSEPVDIINLSLGTSSYSQTAAAVFGEARDAGVIVVAAAGNGASSQVMYPAGYDGVVSVSAVGYGGSFASSYSSYGDTIDVAAPGGSQTDQNADGKMDGVMSTCAYSSGSELVMNYKPMIGTSMAGPHVSGVVALMKALYPGLTPDEFDQLLAGGYLTQDLGDEGWDSKYGWGLIDAYQAVSMVANGEISESLPAILSVSPQTLSFGASLTSAEVTVSGSGGDLVLDETSPEWSATWLTVTPTEDVGTDGLGTYTVTVDRDGISSGAYSDTILFTTTDGSDVDVSVTMRVASDTETTDSGYYYVLLVDSDTREVVGQSGGGEEDGLCDYSFSGLSYGESYIIYAGTDPDNDYYICGEGEICGAYLSLDSPVSLTVSGDLTGIDFTTDTVFSLSSESASISSDVNFSLQRFDTETEAP